MLKTIKIMFAELNWKEINPGIWYHVNKEKILKIAKGKMNWKCENYPT